jgi:hypothetical protein
MILDKMIPRVSGISYEKFNSDFVIPQIPVVLKNAVNDWPALKKWTPEYLNSKIGSVKMGMKKSATHKHPDINQADPGATSQTTFSEYLQKTIYNQDAKDRVKYYVSGDENFFYKEGERNEAIKVLMDDFSTPNLFPLELLRQTSFWISVKGLFSWLHFDGNCYNNVNIQIEGSKKVHLINPNDVDKLYPITLRETPHGFNFSKVDTSNYDESMFPKFKDVRYQETILEKGEMLYIPVTWYHAVHHLGDVNINVNFWWQPELVKLNPTMMRAEMFKLFDQAYLRREVMKQPAPRWENWCKKDAAISDFIFQCDEFLANGQK